MDNGGIPLRLNTGHAPVQGAEHARERRDALGTLAYTRQFEQRLEQARRAETAEDHLPYSQWHRSPYVLSRLKARLGVTLLRAIFAKRAAIERLYAESAAALDDWRDWRKAYDGAVADAVQPFGLRVRDVERAERMVDRLVRSELMSYRPARVKR